MIESGWKWSKVTDAERNWQNRLRMTESPWESLGVQRPPPLANAPFSRFLIFWHPNPEGPEIEKNHSRSKAWKDHSPTLEIFVLAWKLHSRFEIFIRAWKSQSRALFFAAREGLGMKKPFSIENFISYWRLDFFNISSRDWFFSILGPSGKVGVEGGRH